MVLSASSSVTSVFGFLRQSENLALGGNFMEIKKASDMQRHGNWRIMIYAAPGIGKTSMVRQIPGKKLLIDLDGSAKVLSGTANIDVVTLDRTRPTDSLYEIMREVPKILGKYDCLVVDNLSSLQKDWFVEQAQNSKSKLANEIQDYNRYDNFIHRFVSSIYSLPINVFVTAWEATGQVTLLSGQIISRYMPDLREKSLIPIMGLTDVVGRLMINPSTGNRGVILEGNDGQYCKNRMDSRKACLVEEMFDFQEV